MTHQNKTEYGIKIRKIKEVEKLNDCEMAAILGITPGDMPDCEDGRLISLTILSRLTHSRKCMKYAVWLMINKILPATGQISPDIARCGLKETTW